MSETIDVPPNDLGAEIMQAQLELRNIAMGQNMNSSQAGISAYVNSLLASCRLDALTELFVSPPNATWTREQALDAAILRALRYRAASMSAQIEAERSRIQVATPGSAVSKLIRPN